MDLRGKKVMVTGGGGFLGRHIVAAFRREGARVSAPRSRWFDLTKAADSFRLFSELTPQIVVHAAADVGGIGYNQTAPADIFHNNLMMTANVLRAAEQTRVEKLVIIGSACGYPGDLPGDLSEDAYLAGPMHPSVDCYGFSKRALLSGARAYRQQFGLNSVFLVPTNLYGPWDNFDPKESHVVAALVRKFDEAVRRHEPRVVCWGSGRPVREFLYVEDCAQAIVRATQLYESSEPLNIGTGVGTSIRELADVLRGIYGCEGQIAWDTSKPDGAMRKVLDVSRMRQALRWEPGVMLEEGLRRTVEWYRAVQPVHQALAA